MNHILKMSDLIAIRNTQEKDLDFVINIEHEPDNAQYVGQWTKEQHKSALFNKDILHLLVEDKTSSMPVGYVIMAGLENQNNSIEFRRIVIADKGKGFGKETLTLIKEIAFKQLKAHRLWLDVRYKNIRAQNLYKSQGFVQDGILRDSILYNGNYESLIVMSVLEDEYKSCLI